MKGCYYSAKTRHKESESERRLSVTKQSHVQREGNESLRDSDRTKKVGIIKIKKGI